MKMLSIALLSAATLSLFLCSTALQAEWVDEDGHKFPTAAEACAFRANKLQQIYGRRAKVTWSLTPTPLHSPAVGWRTPDCFLTVANSRAAVPSVDHIWPACGAGFVADLNAPSGCAPKTSGEPPPNVVNIFIGGFFDDTINGPVKTYLSPDNPVQIPNHHYFPHSPESDILDFIAGLPEYTVINIVGHSYGGDTAVMVAGQCRRRVHLLITIDPVNSRDPTYPVPPGPAAGRPPSTDSMLATRIAKIKAMRANTGIWVDVDALPDEPDDSDRLAELGGKWDYLPWKPVQYADIFIPGKGFHHKQFEQMMQDRRLTGRSPQDMLLGK